MRSVIKEAGTRNLCLASKVLPVVLLAFILLAGAGLCYVSEAEASGTQALGDLDIGARVVDLSWQWEHRNGDNYSGSGVTKPVIWIVVAKDHYGDNSGVTLLSEEIIGRHAFDNSSHATINGYNHWGESGMDASTTQGLRPWLNSTGIHAGTVFYNVFSKSFKNSIAEIVLPNKEWQHGNPYTTNNKVFIPSTTELGDTAHDWTYMIRLVYPYFDEATDADRIAQLGGISKQYWTRSPMPSLESDLRIINTGGQFNMNYLAENTTVAVRPALNLKGDTLVSGTPNTEGAYEIISPPAWFKIAPESTQNLAYGNAGDLAVAFERIGVWEYDGSGWNHLAPEKAVALTYDNGSLAVAFEGFGVWLYE